MNNGPSKYINIHQRILMALKIRKNYTSILAIASVETSAFLGGNHVQASSRNIAAVDTGICTKTTMFLIFSTIETTLDVML